ncbi:hypothetical protein [Taklimakanibacter deserti]|uniref:hypothetical protein n=1 Tax=Taklimakanibacter deserti TaxID=2267839 RepID=UPI000E6483B5
MGIENPTETVIGILDMIDEVRGKVADTPLAAFPWRPLSPAAADDVVELSHDAMVYCDDLIEAVIVVTVVSMLIAAREGLA